MASCCERNARRHKMVYRLELTGPGAPFRDQGPQGHIKTSEENHGGSATPRHQNSRPDARAGRAALGAEVIKIERPGGGDDARAFGPPYLKDPEGKENNNNSFYLCANRGKKSVTVNIAKPEGQEIIRKLAKSSDFSLDIK